MGHHSTITRVFLPSSSADLAVGLSNRWFFKPGLKTFNSPFHLTQRRSLTFNNIMNGYLQHDWWVWVPYIVTTGVGLFESYGKKSWILVDFLVDPIVCVLCTYTYIHTYIIHTSYIHSYIHTYMYITYIHTYYIHTYDWIHEKTDQYPGFLPTGIQTAQHRVWRCRVLKLTSHAVNIHSWCC